jgi:hypothetical protein
MSGMVMATRETTWSQAPRPGPTDAALTAALTGLYRRRAAVARAARMARGAWIALAVMLPVLLLEALWPMDDAVRCGITVAMLVLAGVGLVRLGRRDPDEGKQPWHEAAGLERHFGLSRNPLLNALWLGVGPEGQSLTAALTRRVVEQGRDVARDPRLEQSIDRRALRRQGSMLLGMVLVWLLATAVAPRLIGGQVARFADPWGDHPPFSLTAARVRLNPAQPIAGQDVLVMAELRGRPVQSADLVEVDSRGHEVNRTPMDWAGGAVFQSKLLALREPMIVEVQWPTGRSHRLTIQPRRVEAAGAQASAATPPVEPHPGVSGDNGGGGDPHALLRALAARTGAMADAAQRLRAWVARLGEVPALGAEDQPEGFNELRQGIEQQALRGQDLGRLLDQLQEAGPAALDSESLALLRRIRADLQALGLPSFAAGMTGSGPAARHAGWEQLAVAAGHDAQLLDADARALAEFTGGHAGAGAGVGIPGGTAAHVGAGNTAENAGAGQTPHPGSAALAEQAPAMYRLLVGRYYDRLAADSTPAPRPEERTKP